MSLVNRRGRQGGISYHPYQTSVWTGGAYSLQQYLRQQGIDVTINYANNIIARGGDFKKFIKDNASTDPEGRIISRFDQRLGPRRTEDIASTSTAQQMTVQDMDMGSMVSVGGTLQYANDTKSRGRFSSNKKKNVKRMLISALMKDLQEELIWRYQSLTPFYQGGLRAYFMHNVVNATYPTPTGDQFNKMDCPVYAFNLSALPKQGERLSVPFYRLVKRLYANPESYASYLWEPQAKVLSNSGGANEIEPGSKTWTSEATDMEIMTKTYKRYIHNWSEIQLMLQGAGAQQSKWEISIVSFLEECGPARQYWEDAAFTTWDVPSAEPVDTSNRDTFWDNYLQTKVVHPMAKNGPRNKDSRQLVVHKRFYHNFGIESNQSADAREPNHHMKIFYKNGDSYNLQSNFGLEASGKFVNHFNVNPPAGSTANPPGYAVQQTALSNSALTPFCHKQSADKWLLITCTNYLKQSTTYNTDNCPSFDLSVRGKFTNLKGYDAIL